MHQRLTGRASERPKSPTKSRSAESFHKKTMKKVYFPAKFFGVSCVTIACNSKKNFSRCCAIKVKPKQNLLAAVWCVGLTQFTVLFLKSATVDTKASEREFIRVVG